MTTCEECGAQFEDESSELCDNCGGEYCPECWTEVGSTYKDMAVCTYCKSDLETDKGIDPQDIPEDF